mmetsp:Transcript_45120/g.118348  ORF Transcript_45120/g.118348 Transcript_45120/m.118348 type:complete len:402 (+) Transcript_45120:218-1423(+)
MVQVAWLSVDPVRRKVDFYPKAIAARIEKSWNDRDPWTPSACVLGSDFFNATVHFHPSGSCYQTTPGLSMGRAGFKQPGYRSVKRHVKHDGDSGQVVIFSKQVHGEWRIAATEAESELKFEEPLPPESIVEGGADAAEAATPFRPWRGEDLTSGAWDVSVVVWQWCLGVPEKQGNLMALSDAWWCPYLADANSEVEAAFARSEDELELTLPGSERRVKIRYTRDQSFAVQRDDARNKERAVRRVVKTIQEVKVMLDRMTSPPLDLSDLVAALPADTIPHHFFCPISQDIMSDPVRTVDGHTYDRVSIERWFQHNHTSPLTGLVLPSVSLESHAVLRQQIEDFVAALPPEQKASLNPMAAVAAAAAVAGLVDIADPSPASGGGAAGAAESGASSADLPMTGP